VFLSAEFCLGKRFRRARFARPCPQNIAHRATSLPGVFSRKFALTCFSPLRSDKLSSHPERTPALIFFRTVHSNGNGYSSPKIYLPERKLLLTP
jgi:hypothetical protein